MRYDQLKETLKYNMNVIKMEDVASSARSKEREMKSLTRSRVSSVGHYVRGRSDNRSLNHGKNRNGRSRSKSTEMNKVCWICGNEGHFKKQCYKWLDKNKQRSQGLDKEESAMVRDDAQDLVGLIANEINLSQEATDKEELVMDTCCSFHMTPRRDMFLSFTQTDVGKVKMANNTSAEVKGVG